MTDSPEAATPIFDELVEELRGPGKSSGRSERKPSPERDPPKPDRSSDVDSGMVGFGR